MSISVMSLVFSRFAGSPTKKVVLLCMADAANNDGSGIWMSAQTVADKCEISRRSVMNVWSDFEDRGLILRDGIRRVRGGKVTEWRINLGAVEALGQPCANSAQCESDNANPVNLVPKPCERDSHKPLINHPNKPLEVLESIWSVWSATGRKRSHSKTKLIRKLSSLAKTENLDELLKAFKMMAKGTDAAFHPGIQAVLNSGQWKNWVGQDKSRERDPKVIDLDEWKRAASAYCEFEAWPRDLGPAPHEEGCAAPVGLLKSIATRMDGHRWSSAISANAENKAITEKQPRKEASYA